MKNQLGESHLSHGLQQSANHVVVKIHLINSKSSLMNDLKPSVVKTLTHDIDLLFEVGSLGTSCSFNCGGCHCGKCAIGVQKMLMQEEREFKLINKSLSYDPGRK